MRTFRGSHATFLCTRVLATCLFVSFLSRSPFGPNGDVKSWSQGPLDASPLGFCQIRENWTEGNYSNETNFTAPWLSRCDEWTLMYHLF